MRNEGAGQLLGGRSLPEIRASVVKAFARAGEHVNGRPNGELHPISPPVPRLVHPRHDVSLDLLQNESCDRPTQLIERKGKHTLIS
jgi:hypothetical protein